jgi:PAS domain S-box-containing protein
MTRTRKPARGGRNRLQDLRRRLRTAEDTLRVIRAGEVDALVVTRPRGERVVTLAGAELPYSIMFEQMYEGAITLTRDGIIVYCNRRFADMVGTPVEGIVGQAIHDFVPAAEQPVLDALRKGAKRESTRGELSLCCRDDSLVPVSLSFAPLQLKPGGSPIGTIGVIADVSELKRGEEIRARLTSQVISAQDDERRRIARELHDETGQSLTGLLVGLRTIEASRALPEAIELAQQLRAIAAESLEALRALVSGLHPSILDELGLAAAVERHAQQVARLHGMDIDVRFAEVDSDGMPPIVQNTIYRVLQESLTNVVRHAGTRSATVRLARHSDSIELRVRDQGRGVRAGPPADRSGSKQHRGLGLRGMRERAELLGGSLRVESRAGEGTTVICRIPLQSPLVSATQRVSEKPPAPR